jgi:hypothetical protein
MKLIRTIHPEIRVLDSKAGIVEYVASDETLDSYREIIRASGWRFTNFQKNAPFVDSHDYSALDKLVGKVTDFKVVGRQLVETVQWAVDVVENKLAQLGWRMTEAGYLKAVSVGFMPVRRVSQYDQDPTQFKAQLKELGITTDTGVRAIYLEQEQIELSVCIIGANPNALAKSYKAGILSDADLDLLSLEHSKRETAPATDDPAAVARATQRARELFLGSFEMAVKSV